MEAVEELSDPHPLLCFPFQNIVQRLGQQGVQRVADQLLDRALAESLRPPKPQWSRASRYLLSTFQTGMRPRSRTWSSVIATPLQLARSSRRPAARSRTLRVFASIWWPSEIPVTQVEGGRTWDELPTPRARAHALVTSACNRPTA